ncbi:urate hydroxylase PuuD [Alteromonas sp. Cnat3-28]|uniref:urate hydroxylase PuuD n=1 Tax=Alteromonas sp. Cnat3-28 TaxID=2917729 RepID=UPI001EF41F99|nr:urate hydroxylase PuuD [Alteromonas sp. Cnat3-28]MCG7646671.1 urate hydroxylase PuuD [Alteromonas sp. Cnat3-28]MEE3029021.1 urate hydroxylase PuuD [Pseudomonadota bacterium]
MPWLDWISLFVRWFHVVAGVAWIGASFYFIWLDNNLRTPPKWKQDKGIKGDLWAIHGGGFYEVAKYAYGPEKMPETLHWFKWEAYTTWLSGFALLIIVYYFGASAYLIDPSVNAMSPTTAISLGLGLIFGGLGLYEFACRSPLAKYPLAFGIGLVALVCIVSYLSTQWFSGRGAYIHVGALIGTIMAGNVFFNIMPNQRKMVAAVADKKDIDPTWGASAKLRSVHNNYFTLPLLFIMISNHYPMTYQHPQNWLVLIAIMAAAAWIRHFFNLRHVGTTKPGILVSGAVAMLAIALWVSWPQSPSHTSNEGHEDVSLVDEVGKKVTANNAVAQASSEVSNERVVSLITTHCVDCHSRTPTDDIFKVAPLGVVLDTWEDIERFAPQVVRRTTVTKDMPFLNKTKMTDKERQEIARWFAQRQQ